METGGAPLKPWEVARKTPSLTAADAQEEKQERQPSTQPTPSYTPYSRFSTPYGSPYQSTTYGTPYGTNYGGSYGGNYGSCYGYPSSYGSNMYGNYGGAYGYGRPSPWSTPQIPNMGEASGGGGSKSPMWQRFLDGLQKIVQCFGRVSFLVDENTQAFHFFITALLTFLDKAGSLYGEIARFVMKLLRFRGRSKGVASKSASTRATVDATNIFKSVWKK